MLDIVSCNFEKVYSILITFLKKINMCYEALLQISFCYHLLYFIEIHILFLIVNFIRFHGYYFYVHNWLDHLGLWLSKSLLFIFIYPC